MSILRIFLLLAAGAILGYLLCALLVIAKRADRIAKKAEQ